MARKHYKIEEIIARLREAEVLSSQSKNIADIVRTSGVTTVTYYRWREEYGRMEVDQAKRLKDLEIENARLKRAVADQVLDMAILKQSSGEVAFEREKILKLELVRSFLFFA